MSKKADCQTTAFIYNCMTDIRALPLFKKIAAATLASLSVFCLLYWAVCILFAGPAISILWIWPLAALAFAALTLWAANLPPFRRIRRHRAARIAVIVVICLLFGYFAVIEGLVISGMNDRGEQHPDYIIVLGAKVNGITPSLSLRHRIDSAASYLKENPNVKVIVSGGQGHDEDISEAECMRRELIEKGISPDRIITEDKSTSTDENIAFSLPLMEEGASFGVVTNNFHVWRAIRIAEKQSGQEVCAISAPYPNALILHYMAREFVTITVYILTGKI